MCVALLAASDATLLQAAQTYFTGGFNSQYLKDLPSIAAFFALGLLVDLTWVLGIWSLLLPALGRLPGSALQRFVIAGGVAIGIPLVITFAAYELYRIVGGMASLALLWEAGGRSMEEMVAQALPHLPQLALLAAPVILGVAALLFGARRLEARIPDARSSFALPATTQVVLPFLVCLVVSIVGVVATAATSPSLWFGLGSKSSTRILSPVIERATDPDGDGFHAISSLSDPAPFDGAIHPWAIETPGDGIDDNGLAGDLPAGFASPHLRVAVVDPDTFAGEPHRPHFLLIFLESFREDILGATLEGQAITPSMDALAREGAMTRHAYAHSPNTAGSRAHLFSGSTAPLPGQRTLVDDFKARGYFVAHFSAQDDSFNDGERQMGISRADFFYDARQDVELRSSRASSAGGLQISWKLLMKRVTAFLDGYDFERPLFLYVNFTDTHFPYHHAEMDDLLGVVSLDRNEIGVDRAPEVWATYANAAANVDRAIGELVASWRGHLGGARNAILVTPDHGQSLYDRGFLGHGQSLTPEQTRTPIILVGARGDWPEPMGLAEVRGLLNRHLFGDDPRVRFVPDSTRRVLQMVPSAERPLILALRGLDGSIEYDLRTRELQILDAEDAVMEVSEEDREAALAEVVRAWEANRIAARAGGAP